MIHIRDEGGVIRTGFNFYPLSSNQFGFVFKLNTFVLYVRYNKQLGKFKCHKPNTTYQLKQTT